MPSFSFFSVRGLNTSVLELIFPVTTCMMEIFPTNGSMMVLKTKADIGASVTASFSTGSFFPLNA